VHNDFRVGPWLVRPGLNTISQNGTSNRVEPKMMEVLVCLAEHTGEVVTKERLLQVAWPDTFVSDDVLKRSVSEYAAYLVMTPTRRVSSRPSPRRDTAWSRQFNPWTMQSVPLYLWHGGAAGDGVCLCSH
jgi:hypothetical protein